MEYEIIQILDEILGQHKQFANGELYYFCPFCSHHNKKFAVNIFKGVWHCWKCEKSGRSFVGLLRRINAPVEKIHKMASLVQTRTSKKYEAPQPVNQLDLPPEFIPLWKKNTSPEYKQALAYLYNRNITDADIIKHNIGYCEAGRYSYRVIVPNFDEEGKINFFSGRSYYPENKLKHLTPQTSKNIIGFERQINWDYPIVLCEGVYDALAIRRNAIPLYGKTISDKLKEKIVEEGVRKIYLALDQDALPQIARIAEYFMNEGIAVYYVDLPGKDPSEIGFATMQQLIRKAEPLTFGKLMQLKLQNV